jgi:NitT/TauT family transport system permease protein
VLPILASLNSIPIIAISPIAVLWLGFGQPSKIAVVALMTFAPMVVNAFKGLYSIDPASLELMTSLSASPAQVFWKLRLPHALPYIFTALKVGTTLAMIGAVVAEFFNAQRGLGVDLSNNIQVAKMPIAWAAIVAAALLGLVLFGLVSLAERAIIPWHVSFRTQEE